MLFLLIQQGDVPAASSIAVLDARALGTTMSCLSCEHFPNTSVLPMDKILRMCGPSRLCGGTYWCVLQKMPDPGYQRVACSAGINHAAKQKYIYIFMNARIGAKSQRAPAGTCLVLPASIAPPPRPVKTSQNFVDSQRMGQPIS